MLSFVSREILQEKKNLLPTLTYSLDMLLQCLWLLKHLAPAMHGSQQQPVAATYPFTLSYWFCSGMPSLRHLPMNSLPTSQRMYFQQLSESRFPVSLVNMAPWQFLCYSLSFDCALSTEVWISTLVGHCISALRGRECSLLPCSLQFFLLLSSQLLFTPIS